MKKVLLVEDEVELSHLLLNQIENIGLDIKVDTVTNAEEGYKKILKSNYQLIISDIRLPGMDGIQMMEKVIKSSMPHPKFFIISGLSKYSKSQIKSKGASHFFEKPQGILDLLKEVKKLFNSQ